MTARLFPLSAVIFLLWTDIPLLEAAGPPEEIVLETTSAGQVRVRMICGNPATDERLALLPQYPSIEILSVSGNQHLTDAGLVHLRRLPNLETLWLGGEAITDKGLAHLAGNTTLRVLGLAELAMTEQAAEQIATLPNLEVLRLQSCMIEPGAWALLAKLPRLREIQVTGDSLTEADGLALFTRLEGLSLGGGKLSSAVLAQITGNTGLRKLSLSRFPLTDAGAELVATLPALESLTLDRMPITSTGIATLMKLRNLTELNVYGDNLTDAELSAFEGFTWLRTLYMTSSQITEPTTHKLRAALPNTVVNLWRWKHTVADLRAMSKDLQTDPAGNVIAVNMSCLKWATDEKMRVLGDFPTITRLRIVGGSDLTDDGLRFVKNLPNLAVIEINSKRVTVAGLKHLCGMESLKAVHVLSSQVTEDGLAELREVFAGRVLDRKVPPAPGEVTESGPD
jgi:hypothetical protein